MALKIIKFGTKVETVIGKIEALVTGVCIRETHIVYELSYFVNGEYKCTWHNPFEFTVVPEKKKAGFVNYDVEQIDPSHMIELKD